MRLGESVSLERSGEQRRNEAEEADEKDGMLDYDSSSSEDLDDESFSTNNEEADDEVDRNRRDYGIEGKFRDDGIEEPYWGPSFTSIETFLFECNSSIFNIY